MTCDLLGSMSRWNTDRRKSFAYTGILLFLVWFAGSGSRLARRTTGALEGLSRTVEATISNTGGGAGHFPRLRLWCVWFWLWLRLCWWLVIQQHRFVGLIWLCQQRCLPLRCCFRHWRYARCHLHTGDWLSQPLRLRCRFRPRRRCCRLPLLSVFVSEHI